METVHKTALTLTIIGAINWGAIGLFDFNVVDYYFCNGILWNIYKTCDF